MHLMLHCTIVLYGSPATLCNGEKQFSTVTVVTVQYFCYSVICLAQDLFTTRSLHQPHSLTINLRVIQCALLSL